MTLWAHCVAKYARSSCAFRGLTSTIARPREVTALETDIAGVLLFQTCFFTTHRYDTIRRADTILVLMEGFIEEVGTPKNLESNA